MSARAQDAPAQPPAEVNVAQEFQKAAPDLFRAWRLVWIIALGILLAESLTALIVGFFWSVIETLRVP